MPTLGSSSPARGRRASGWASTSPSAFRARECFERASEIVGYDLLELCRTGSDEQFHETRISQPAIFTANVAIYRAVETLGLTPIVTAGHSFGEYCSLTIAGSLGFDEAASLVNERGLAMGAAADGAPGSMAAIIGFDQARSRRCARAPGSTPAHASTLPISTR